MPVTEKDRRHFAIIGEGMREKEAERRVRAAGRDPGENATRMLEHSDFWLRERLARASPDDWSLVDHEDEVLAQGGLQQAWAKRRGTSEPR